MKFSVLAGVVVLSLVVSVGYLNNSIALSAQDFGSSDIVEINSLISEASVNFVFDFQTNTITHCDVATVDTLSEGNKIRCQLLDQNDNKIAQGTVTSDGQTNSFHITLNQTPLIDDVESVKVLLIGKSNNSNSSSDTSSSSDTFSTSSTDEDIIICHFTGNSYVTKVVSQNSLSGHLGHGDYMGACQ